MRLYEASFLVRRNAAMSVVWLGFALFCLAFASLPWVIVAERGGALPAAVWLFLFAWSSLPLALGSYLLFWSQCRIELSGGPGLLSRHARWLFWGASADYRIDRAYLVRQWHYSKHGGDVLRDVVFVRTGRRKYRLADELTCADLPGLLRWIADIAQVKTLDARHRRPVGI